MPLAWVMGVDWVECGHVGELIGLKTIVNEFVAYSELSKMKKAGLLSVSASVPSWTPCWLVVQHESFLFCTIPT